MNPNGTHDKALLEEIERLLKQRQQQRESASHPVLDELTDLVPQATQEFEDTLEANLLAKMRRNTLSIPEYDLEAHTPMTSDTHIKLNQQPYEFPSAQDRPSRRFRRLPLTLAAALIAAIIGVGLLLALSNRPNDEEPPIYSALLTATPESAGSSTDTPIPTTTPILSSGQVEATRILAEATQRSIDQTAIAQGTVTPTPFASSTPGTPSSGQLEATRILREATQRALEQTITAQAAQGTFVTPTPTFTMTPTAAPLDLTATAIIGDSFGAQQAGACDVEATLAAACTGGLSAMVEAAVHATLTAMGQSNQANVAVVTATATITPSVTFTPSPVANVTATMTFTPTPVAAQTITQIVVAARQIRRGETFTEADVALRDWPARGLPLDAITRLEDVVGMRARTDLYVEQPILTGMVFEDSDDIPDIIPTALPPGMYGVILPSEQINVPTDTFEVADNLLIQIEINGETISIAQGAIVTEVTPTDLTLAMSEEEFIVIRSVMSEVQFLLTEIPAEQSEATTAQIVVAVQNLRRGEIIEEDDLGLREWPIDAIPENAIFSTDEVVGMIARTDFYIEEPVQSPMIMEDFARNLREFDQPDGQVTVFLPMTSINNTPNGFQPEDRVSISVDAEAGIALEIEHALVLGFVSEDDGYMVLAVSPSEAVILNSLVESDISLILSLVTATQGEETSTQVVTAARTIRRGEVITEDDLDVATVLTSEMPDDAITAMEDVVGMIARNDIYIGQMIESWAIVRHTRDLLDSMVVPEGYRSIIIPLDTIFGGSYGVQQGDHVAIEVFVNEQSALLFEDAYVLGVEDETEFVVVAVLPEDFDAFWDLPESGVTYQISLIPVEQSEETTQIVVALRDIERGARIVRADLEMADVPVNQVPEDAFTDFDSVMGRRARVDFEIGAPLSDALIAPTLEQFVAQSGIEVRENMELIEVPLFQVRRHGDVSSWRALVEVELPNGERVATTNSATFIYSDSLAAPAGVYGLAVPVEDADVLQGLAFTGFPIHVTYLPDGTTESDLADFTPDGYELVTIPMPALLMDAPLRVGERVDVMFAIQFVDIDGEFQAISSENVTNQSPETNYSVWDLALTDLEAISEDSSLPEGAELSPNLTIQRIISNALVLEYTVIESTEAGWVPVNENAETPFVTIAVSPQDAVVLEFLIDENASIAFIRAGN